MKPSSQSTYLAPKSAQNAAQPEASKPLRIVLAGNPNVGKSVVFHALSGVYANVSNFPGTTVETAKADINLGEGKTAYLEDSPGIYGLAGLTDEEKVAEAAILEADLVINVIAAPTIERDLFLTQQLLDYGLQVIVAVNQMDELATSGRTLDLARLENHLGVPVVGMSAQKGEGLDALRHRLMDAKRGHPMAEAPPADILRALEKQPIEQLKLFGLRRQFINRLVKTVIQRPASPSATTQSSSVSRRLGHWLLHPVIGAMATIIVLLALYQIVGVWVAGDLVNLIEGKLMLELVVPAIQQGLGLFLPKSGVLFQLLAGEFGVLTMSLQYIVGVLFPLVLGFYIYLSILEDCGYLPRLAVLSDGLLSKVGLNGRAIIPMILGLGCVTMATVSTRMLASSRERTIAAALLAITIPCSAQLGVIMGLMAVAGGLWGWAIYLGLLLVLFGLIGSVLNRILPGRSTALMMDLPPLRWPNLKNVSQKTWIRTKGFVFEAAPLFVLGSLIVSILQVTGGLTLLQQLLSPLVVGLLKLPAEAAQVFVMGMVRRDFGVAGLFFLASKLSAVQVLTSLVTITLFVPCLASATVLWKERGRLESSVILVASWLAAFLVGGVVAHTAFWLHL
ncbi:MAG: ferrous iron transport protein B [Vampirovibrionales bacterium]|nr:ferrous iron transport protein B [Vampirovibrionales bacterium]